jgi:putative heme iron utilization protein
MHVDAARLVLRERWAALATTHEGSPLATMVAYAPRADLSVLWLFVSEMSAHTRDLLADPRASLAVTAPDTGTGDPQLLPRVTLTGKAERTPPDSPAYEPGKALYLARFPEAEDRLALGDFHLFGFTPESARYVGGFAQALRIDAERLREAARAAAG